MANLRTETRFGAVTALGATYTNLYTVPASTTVNLLLNVTNRTATLAYLRVYIADTSWSTGEPTAGTIKAAIAYDMPITAGTVAQISGIVLNTTEKLVVYSSVAASLDIIASGVAVV